jgi:hypothetical protein
MITDEDFFLIEDSLMGRTSVEQEKSVQMRVNNDPEFAEEYELKKKLIGQVRLMKRTELKEMFSKFEEEIKKDGIPNLEDDNSSLEKQEERKPRIQIIRNYKFIAAAAILLIISVFSIYRYNTAQFEGVVGIKTYSSDTSLGYAKDGEEIAEIIAVFEKSTNDKYDFKGDTLKVSLQTLPLKKQELVLIYDKERNIYVLNIDTKKYEISKGLSGELIQIRQ